MKFKKLKFLFVRICYEKIYVNAGVRAVFGQNHRVDFYARFGFLTQSKEYDKMIKWEVSQPYLIGVRYTYTFWKWRILLCLKYPRKCKL